MAAVSIVYGHIGAISGTNVVAGLNATVPTGTNNVILGNGAGANVGSGSYNVVIGSSADASGVSYSTAIGQGAVAKANYAVAIGHNVVNTAANSCVIGNSSNQLYTEDFGRGFIRYTQNAELDAGGYYSSYTLSGAEVLDGFLFFKSDLTGYVYWPDAVDIVDAFIAPEVNCMSYGYLGSWYSGSSDDYFNILAGTGVTYYGPGSLGDGESGIYTISLTNVTPGSEAVTITWYYN